MQTHKDWISPEDQILTMSDRQLHFDVPAMMQMYGFTEEEIRCAVQIVVEFHYQHQMPVIE